MVGPARGGGGACRRGRGSGPGPSPGPGQGAGPAGGSRGRSGGGGLLPGLAAGGEQHLPGAARRGPGRPGRGVVVGCGEALDARQGDGLGPEEGDRVSLSIYGTAGSIRDG